MLKFLQSPLGRLLGGSLGILAITLIIRHAGFEQVSSVLSSASKWMPWILICEAGFIGCNILALRVLYAEDRKRIPKMAFVRSGLIGWAVMGLVPAGRAVAEAGRALMLSRYSTGTRATAAAVKLQGVTLIANSVASFFGVAAIYWVSGLSLAFWLILINFLVTGVMGGGVVLVARKRAGTWLSQRLPQVQSFKEHGPEFDRYMTEDNHLFWPAIGFECLGRVFQTFQNGILVFAVGGALGVMPALISESIHLAGAMVGDLLPAQLGATEAMYQVMAGALGLTVSKSVSIALLAHVSQLTWVGVGSMVALSKPPEPIESAN